MPNPAEDTQHSPTNGIDDPAHDETSVITEAASVQESGGAVRERPAKRLKTDASPATPPVAPNPGADAPGALNPASTDEAMKEPRDGSGNPGLSHDGPATEGKAQESPSRPEPERKQQRIKGIAHIKPEYVITALDGDAEGAAVDDDAAEGREDARDGDGRGRNRRDRNHKGRDKHDRKKKEKGQNKERQFGHVSDKIRLCTSRVLAPEFSPARCKYGNDCTCCHDLRRYLEEGRRDDSGTETFLGGPCPVFEKFGKCYSGWKCRFVKTHMKEIEHPDGRKELVLIDNTAETAGDADASRDDAAPVEGDEVKDGGGSKAEEGEAAAVDDDPSRVQDKIPADPGPGTFDAAAKDGLDGNSKAEGEDAVNGDDPSHARDKQPPPPSDQSPETSHAFAKDGLEGNDAEAEPEGRCPELVNGVSFQLRMQLSRRKVDFAKVDEYIKWMNHEAQLSETFHQRRNTQSTTVIEDLRAAFEDPPFLPSEKRRLYFGPETPVLAPLTTQGNVPFRRLCVELGAQLTYSEMAMSMPLLQGARQDWPLLKAHVSELAPPRFAPARPDLVPDGYDHSRDLKFGAQIAAHTPWSAVKATDVLTRSCPHLRLVDLNCGCPIDMIYKLGGGSSLLSAPGKLERMIRGMNTVSGDVPVTAKLRTGVRSGNLVAATILGKLAFGSREHRERLGAPGCAAVTLHGRTREMRYTKRADWSYIAECAALVKLYNEQRAAVTDTAREPDARTQASAGRMFFLGNGDCFSHEDYNSHIRDSGIDSVMIGRGALVKPWLFEEIEKGQYLDKTSSQRLEYVEKYVRYGLEAWGSDEVGVNFTRRFLLEWLSFHHRYVPVGLLEYLPPSLNDRPPSFRGRDDMETLLASSNYKDWIKISEMFLGPVHPGFRFQPKHKSNSYEETEG